MKNGDRELVYTLIDRTQAGEIPWRQTLAHPVARLEALEPPLKFNLSGGDESQSFLPFVLSVLNQETGVLMQKISEPPGGAGLLLMLFREAAAFVANQTPATAAVDLDAMPSSFDASETLEALLTTNPPQGDDIVSHLGMAQLDSLPFGVVHLDADGRILFYNQNECRHSGLKREDVEGKNFFTQIAPYTAGDLHRRFRDMIEGRATRLVEHFNYVFRAPNQTPREAMIVMSCNRRTNGVRLLIINSRSARR
jgi:photoactive yellow protein